MKAEDNRYTWYFTDGSYIEGEEALNYILKRQEKLDRLIEDIDPDIKEMARFNCTKELISDEGDSDSPYVKLLTTMENLSILETQCEMILEKLRRQLHE